MIANSPSGRHVRNADNDTHGKHGAHDSNARMTAMKRFTGNVLIPVIVAMILILGQGYAFMQSYGALTMPDADMHTQ